MFLKKIENRERAMAMYHEKITICVNSLNPKKGKGRIIHKMGSELRGELTFPQPNLISKINPQKFLRAWDKIYLCIGSEWRVYSNFNALEKRFKIYHLFVTGKPSVRH